MSLSKHCQCDLEATANHHKTPIKPSEKSIKHMWFTVLPMHLRIGTQLLASSTKVSPEQDFTAQCPWRCSYHTVTQWTCLRVGTGAFNLSHRLRLQNDQIQSSESKGKESNCIHGVERSQPLLLFQILHTAFKIDVPCHSILQKQTGNLYHAYD